MTHKTCLTLLLATTSLLLAACNAGPLLNTGSITTPAAATPPPPATAVDRALHVAATSARAQKCGYFFDPTALRTNYLAAEAQRGTAPDMLAKATQAYDYTHRSVYGKIAGNETYCNSDDRTAKIKSSLNQMLAGNFEAPPPQKAKQDGGLFSSLALDNDTGTKEAFNPDHIYDPLLNESATKRVEQE